MRRVDRFREEVWWADDLSPNEKLLAQAMARFMDFDTLSDCRPGNDLLVKITGLSESTVKRALKSLVRKGRLKLVAAGGRGRGGRGRAAFYQGQLVKGVTVTRKGGHGEPPPSQYQRRPDGTAAGAAAPGAANNASPARDKHRRGCTCHDCYHGRKSA